MEVSKNGEIEVSINGESYSLFESISLSRSLDNATGSFSIIASSGDPDSFPVNRGDVISITVNSIPKLYGFIDDVEESGDNEGHIVTLTGRDNTCDLIDSTVPPLSSSLAISVGGKSTNLSFKDFAKSVVWGLGIKMNVVDLSNQDNIILPKSPVSYEPSDYAMAVLQNIGRKFQVFLIPSGAGDLVIYRPGNEIATTSLIHRQNDNNNNVKSYKVKQSQVARYNKYVVRSQDNYAADDDATCSKKSTSRSGIIIDPSIREGRLLEIIGEENMDDATCYKRAEEESNIRRARSTSYSCVVAGLTQTSGVPWDIGQTVTVDDETAKVKGSFIIRSVIYSKSITDGKQTSIVCAPIDAYKAQALETAGDKRVSSMPFADGTPTEQSRPRR